MQRLGALIFILFVCCVGSPTLAAITCTATMTNVNFGSVNVLSGAAVDTTATETITCSGATANTSYVFCTDITAGADVSGTQRRMASGTNRINFDLYKDAARTQEWGNYASNFLGGGSQNSFTSNASGNISATITLYARLAGNQQTAIPGSYSESMASGTNQRLHYNATSGTCSVGTSTANFSLTVSATVLTSCSVTATNLNFGSAGVLTSNVDATNTVTPQCTNGTPYNIGLNAGTGTGATVAARKMSNGSVAITYSLYSNSTRTTVWGNTIGTDTVSGTGTGNNQVLTVYGRVPPQTTPAAQTYTDTIIVTVTY